MGSRIGIMMGAIALALLVAVRAENLGAGHGWTGSSAWAQESQDQAAQDQAEQDQTAQDQAADAQDDDAAVSPEGDASQDAYGSPTDGDVSGAKAKPTAKPTPVSAGGVYSGTVTDANRGAGTISAAISQIRTKVIGTWQDTFVPPAFISGTINAKGTMSLRMRFYLKGNCGYLFSGNFKNGNEISGAYKLTACPKGTAPDHGTLDMLKQ
jgi:hypothetical protein